MITNPFIWHEGKIYHHIQLTLCQLCGKRYVSDKRDTCPHCEIIEITAAVDRCIEKYDNALRALGDMPNV